jgi:GxxExxY protein
MKPQSTLRKPLFTQKDFPLQDITKQIISCAIEVHSVLGPGLLESVYEEALAHEFRLRKLRYERQKEISLSYKGKDIGNHRIDYLTEDEVIVELKAVETMHRIYEAQVLTYLRALGKRVGLLINFNVVLLKDGIKRLILQRTQRANTINPRKLKTKYFSAISVVIFQRT